MFHLFTEAQFVTLLVAAPDLIFCAIFAAGAWRFGGAIAEPR